MTKQLCLQLLVTVTDDFDKDNFDQTKVFEKMFLTENYEAYQYYDEVIKKSIIKKYNKLGFCNLNEDSIFQMGSYFLRLKEPIKFTVKKEEYLVEEDQEIEISSIVTYSLKDIPELFNSLECHSIKIETIVNNCFAKRTTNQFDLDQILSATPTVDLINTESV